MPSFPAQAGAVTAGGSGIPDSNARKTDYLGIQYGVIRDKVYKHLTYPPVAEAEGWEGAVKVRFFVKQDGDVDGVRVEKSSGYAMLDGAAVRAVIKAAPFPAAPFRLEIKLPVVFKLRTVETGFNGEYYG